MKNKEKRKKIRQIELSEEWKEWKYKTKRRG